MENNAEDLEAHSFAMREELQSHIQHFGTYLFAVIYQHEEIKRPIYAIFTK